MTQQTMTSSACPECGSKELVQDMQVGEAVCHGCGLVVRGTMISRGPEWRAFTLQEKQSKPRTGAPILYSRFDKSLSTTMKVNKDAFGRPLPAETRRQMLRLRKWHFRANMYDSKARNLMQAMNELERLTQKLHIPPSVQETAALFYRKALSQNLVRGRCIVSIAAAALYLACRFTKTSRTLTEVAAVSLKDKKELSRCYRLLLRRLHIRMPVDSALDYVPKIAEKAGASAQTEGLAARLVRQARKEHLTSGKDPSGLAGAAVYIASQLTGERLTQAELSKAANVTEVTIRNRKKDLIRGLDINSAPIAFD
jgi:transcription initiation factor TFIIB